MTAPRIQRASVALGCLVALALPEGRAHAGDAPNEPPATPSTTPSTVPSTSTEAPIAPAPAPVGPATPTPKIAYDKGVEVRITSKDPSTEVFLAHGDVPIDTFPDPYERVGLAPLTIKLAAGTYSLETASPTQSTAHDRFMVEQGHPLDIEVRPGDANVKSIGAVLAGLGVVSIVLGVVAIVSFSPNDSSYNRFGVGLPLIIGGAAGCGIGIGMTVLGATTVRVDPHAQPRYASGVTPVPTLTLAF